jgi:hypothetical protein
MPMPSSRVVSWMLFPGWKAMISEDAARAITAGAQPVSGASIILICQGNLYIVPDKRMGDGKMASDTVRSSASNAGK